MLVNKILLLYLINSSFNWHFYGKLLQRQSPYTNQKHNVDHLCEIQLYNALTHLSFTKIYREPIRTFTDKLTKLLDLYNFCIQKFDTLYINFCMQPGKEIREDLVNQQEISFSQ